MLSFSINNNNLSIRNEIITNSENSAFMTLSGNVIEIQFPSDRCGSVMANDIVSFYRNEGNPINYYEETFVRESDSYSDPSKIKIDGFSDIDLKIIKAEIKTIGQEEYVFFTLNKEHFANEAEVDIKRVVVDDSEIDELCNGDIFIWHDYFKYKKTLSGHEPVSVKCLLYWKTAIEGDVVMANCLVPCTIDGADMKKTLAIKMNDDVRYLYNNYRNFKVWTKDNRFFYYTPNGDYWILLLKPNAFIRLRKGDPVINIGIENDFSTSLLQADSISQFLEKEAKNKITSAIDYEKQQFVPVIFGENDKIYDVEKLTFYMHLRERDVDWNVIADGGWPSLNVTQTREINFSSATRSLEQDEYDANDEGGSSSSGVGSGGSGGGSTGGSSGGEENGNYVNPTENYYSWNEETIVKDVPYTETESYDYDDLKNSCDNVLENGDFEEEDVYYQHKCVSETFLRLSFYNEIDRGTQKLLYTAKLYLDENRLWTEYVKQDDEEQKYVPFCFTCTNKYDYNNKTEGFYLHLFPSNLSEGEVGYIYMKAELCHAKYGKTIPLTLPVYPNVDINGEPYREIFNGKTYMTTDSGKVRTNMKELNNDMYIQIRIKHDDENKRYVWGFLGANEGDDANELQINLWEPKMF